MARATTHSKPSIVWHVTSVKFAPDEHAALKRIAEVDRRSLSAEIRHLVARRVEEIDALDREPESERDAA